MTVTLRYYGHLRQLTGTESEAVAAAGVHDALRAAAARHGQAFAGIVLDASGAVGPGVIVLVNDEPIGGTPRPLVDGDTVSLIPVIAGG